MDDDRVAKLLEEIRDLQRQHVENYKEALANQREALAFNERWQQRQRRMQLIVIAMIVIVSALLAVLFIVGSTE